jgi:ribosomal protein S18 acetylase RimI-like enzyme
MLFSTSSIFANRIEAGDGGRLTLDFVEEQARGSGVRSIHLEVVRPNANAKEFYRRNGYLDHQHSLMSKWIERGFSKPGTH